MRVACPDCLASGNAYTIRIFPTRELLQRKPASNSLLIRQRIDRQCRTRWRRLKSPDLPRARRVTNRKGMQHRCGHRVRERGDQGRWRRCVRERERYTCCTTKSTILRLPAAYRERGRHRSHGLAPGRHQTCTGQPRIRRHPPRRNNRSTDCPSKHQLPPYRPA